MANLLLAASGALRLARAAVVMDGPAWVARLEAVFGSLPCAAEISTSLESCSVGCSICGSEIKTLLDPAIAQRFLELRGSHAVALA
jgi:hypothetical protein